MTVAQAERIRLPFGHRFKGRFLGDIVAEDWDYFVYLTGLQTYGPVAEAIRVLYAAHRENKSPLTRTDQSTLPLV